MKLTKQGVRDLGGGRPRKPVVVVTCPHVWDRYVDYECGDYWGGDYRTVVKYHCGLCHEVRRG